MQANAEIDKSYTAEWKIDCGWVRAEEMKDNEN